MKWSFKIGRAFGIELRVHITFFLIVLYGAYIWGSQGGSGAAGAIYGAFLIILLFVCVVIHEFSHSLMAIHYGGEVSSITLLPIGGISMLKNMPEEPEKELKVSIVGPLSNVVIAFLLGIAYAALPNKAAIASSEDFANLVFTHITLQGTIFYMMIINLALAIFNLFPAFPLDGGRVLRSILAQRMSYVRATRGAVMAGQIFAFILGIGGILALQPIWILIAIFIYLGAEQEGAGAEMKTILSQFKVSQAVERDTKTLAPTDSLGEAVTTLMHLYQEDFPVIEGNRLEGVLTRSNLIKGLHSLGPGGKVGQVMETVFPVVSADAPFSEVYQKISESGVKAVPVVDMGRLIGMVTLEHLSEVFMLLTATDKPFPMVPRAG